MWVEQCKSADSRPCGTAPGSRWALVGYVWSVTSLLQPEAGMIIGARL